MQMGAYDLMPRKTAAVYRSSETLVSTSSESDGGVDSIDNLTASSGCPSPQPGSGRSDSNLPGQLKTPTRRRASLDLNCKSTSYLQKSAVEEGKECYVADSTPVALMLKRRLQDRLFLDLSGSFSGARRLSEGSALVLRGLERSRSGDFYKNSCQYDRPSSTNGSLNGKLRPCFSEGVKIAPGRTAFSFFHNSQTSFSNSLSKVNNGLHGSLSSRQRQTLLQSHSNQLLVSDETLEDSCRWKRNRSYSPDSFESGDLRHGKRFLQGLQSDSMEINISEEELTLSNVFQVRKL